MGSIIIIMQSMVKVVQIAWEFPSDFFMNKIRSLVVDKSDNFEFKSRDPRRKFVIVL